MALDDDLAGVVVVPLSFVSLSRGKRLVDSVGGMVFEVRLLLLVCSRIVKMNARVRRGRNPVDAETKRFVSRKDFQLFVAFGCSHTPKEETTSNKKRRTIVGGRLLDSQSPSLLRRSFAFLPV